MPTAYDVGNLGAESKGNNIVARAACMKKWREGRHQCALAVRVLGMDVNGRPILETVQTVNISRHGVVIEGLRSRVNPGEVVSLQYKGRKVRYRVVGEGIADTERVGQLGLEQVNLHDDLWQKDLPSPPAAVRDKQARRGDRRRHRRFEAFLPVELRCEQAVPVRAETSDVSLSGCYINTLSPWPIDTVVTLVIWLRDQKLAVKGRVRTSILGVGSGIDFVDLSEADRKQLAEYLKNYCKPVTDRRKDPAGKTATKAEVADTEVPSASARTTPKLPWSSSRTR